MVINFGFREKQEKFTHFLFVINVRPLSVLQPTQRLTDSDNELERLCIEGTVA